MGPVWRLIRGQKDICHRCGQEILDFPAVGRVVDFQFHAEEKYCWECYRYLPALRGRHRARSRRSPTSR